ncbi:unnamed protein product [Sphagnum jensenii]|jgi:hypothetical protein|uniref:Uncharacterized protein n=1 Tax=Sphagnum jensenii TaxID=128206 RepID=A0ABP1BTH0_9BRYO
MGFYAEQSFLVEVASMFELQHAGVMNHTGSGLVGIANRSISKCIGDLEMILPNVEAVVSAAVDIPRFFENLSQLSLKSFWTATNSVEEALEGLPKGSCNIP